MSGVLNGHILLAHNARFDVKFLAAEAQRCYAQRGSDVSNGYPFISNVVDTIDLAKQQLRQGPYRLDDLLQRFGLDNTGAHHAVDDASATGDLLAVMFGDSTQKVSRMLHALGAWHRAADVPALGEPQKTVTRPERSPLRR